MHKGFQTDSSQKSYCYSVSYSQYDTDPNTLIIDPVWTRTACCDVAKNGSVNTAYEHSLTTAYVSISLLQVNYEVP